MTKVVDSAVAIRRGLTTFLFFNFGNQIDVIA